MNSFSTAAETSNKTFAYADYFSLFKEDNFFVREREFISSMNSFDPSTIINLDTTAKKKSHSIIFRVMPRNTLFLRMGSFQQNGLLRNTIEKCVFRRRYVYLQRPDIQSAILVLPGFGPEPLLFKLKRHHIIPYGFNFQ